MAKKPSGIVELASAFEQLSYIMLLTYSIGSCVVLLTAVPSNLSLVLPMMDPQVKEGIFKQDDLLQSVGLSVSCE